ncbi:neuroligin-2-like [Diaphorina citri]|uniref:Neuroligin-2-like n=1 Tax=Diaphorina citri TaxID=121845 RepID=A0A3Q0JQR2_DIACI|nr:neuroligin-2-like [Diaphorina citri]
MPALILIHGESYEWNSGNPYDGSILASYGHLIVVTVNFRLGVLGFLKTGARGSAQGNFGLMDIVAALHWLRENLHAFGGDPDRITLMGHGTGASLANILAVSPVAKDPKFNALTTALLRLKEPNLGFSRTGSVRGEDVPYVLGLPLVDGGPFFPHNYSDQDAAISKQLIHYIANFARKGDPNGPTPPASLDPNHQVPFWDTYDSINQLYLELGSKTEIRNHYRGHKMSLWLNLIPQLHRPGVEDLSMRHHNFLEDGVQYYDGSVRPQTLYRPNLLMPEPTTTSRPKATSTTQPTSATAQPDITTTECVNTSLGPAVDMVRPTKDINTNILKKYANNQYQHYATAFIVTITVGLLLLLLNILIMARICRQRENRSREKKKKPKKRKEDIHAGGPDANSISSSSIEEFKHALSESMNPSVSTMVDLPLQDFKCSPPSGTRRPSSGTLGGPDICPPGYESTDVTSPSIPEPPPPPKNQPPAGCPGNPSILRQQNCPQTPPNLMKKRVQIQEISV